MSQQYWTIKNNSIQWDITPGTVHQDDIEMSGLYCDSVTAYGVKEDGSLLLSQIFFFPMLRTIPNNTHATFWFRVAQEERAEILKDGKKVTEYPTYFNFDGTLSVKCTTNEHFTVEHKYFTATDKALGVEITTIKAEEDVILTLSQPGDRTHSYGRGTKGIYVCKIYHDAPEVISLSKGESFTFTTYCTAFISGKEQPLPEVTEELKKRYKRIEELCDDNLVLETDNPELDLMTRFAKLRAGESIFETLSGKYQSPGGQTYYAAIWCNDQAEYVGPHAAMTGDKVSIEAALNAYETFTSFMSDTYHKLPSSIIAEGLDIWEGAGDRGDAAMYLYGGSLFALYLGDESVARKMYPALKWCAEYCERQKSPEGVICSDSDELEGRFPTDGKANLSTSCLCYGGLKFAAKLADSLGDSETASVYRSRALELEKAIETYFGASLHGFNTYRYSKGFDTLRAWICLPLCMGIKTRAKETLDAMLSSYLWTEEGMLSCEHSEENLSDTIWDRATLYGMKCAFLCGAGDIMTEPLLRYCHKRLVCDRVPYAVEAYPEGAKRQLSAESALFVRVITEGLFGIQPESLKSFSFIPALPKGFGKMSLKKVRISGSCYDISVCSDGWEVWENGKMVASGKNFGERVVI